MTGLTDELLRRRLIERASAGSAPALGTIARSVAASSRRRVAAPLARWAILGSVAACAIVAVALAGGLLNRAVAPAVAPSLGHTASPATATAPPSDAAVPPAPATAWTSIGWSRISAKPFAVTKGTVVTDAIAGGDGFVAVGYSPDLKPVVGHLWTSPDGQVWTRIDGDWLVGLIPDHLLRVGERFALLGRRDGASDNDPIELWTSDDGVTWTQGPSPTGATGYSGAVAAGADGILARFDDQTFTIGVDLGSWTVSTVSWPKDVALRDPADGDGFWILPGATGMGEAGSVRTGAIWTSPDGATWSPASLADPGGAVNQIYRVDGGWVAVGSASTSGCNACFGPFDLTRITWFSTDGHAWIRVPRAESAAADRWYGATFLGDGHRLIAVRPAQVQVIGGTAPPTVDMSETINGTTWAPVDSPPTASGPDIGFGAYVGRHGLVQLPVGVDESSPAAWWGEAVEAPTPVNPLPSPAPSGDATGTLPITGCDELGFSAIRCRAVVTRAEQGMNPPVTDADVLSATVTAPQTNDQSFVTVEIADVLLAFVDKRTANIPVACPTAIILSSSDRVCQGDARIWLGGGVSHDVPCGATPGDANHPCATLPPSPKPAVVAASTPLVVSVFDVPIDHVGHYEVLVGEASLPDGLLSENSGVLGDPRPTAYWIDQGVRIVVRPGKPCLGSSCPEIDSIYHEPFHGPQPVNVYLVFDVGELTAPGAILEIRNLIVR